MLGALFLFKGRLITLEPKHGDSEQIHKVQSREGILGFKTNKRLESFAPRYSVFLLLADFKEYQTLLWF
jgi:hypothetical protein